MKTPVYHATATLLLSLPLTTARTWTSIPQAIPSTIELDPLLRPSSSLLMEDVSFLYQDTTDEVVPTSSTTYSTSYMPSNEPSVSIEMISGNSNVPTWSPTLYKECVGEEELHRLVLYNVTKGAELIVMNGEEAVFEMDFGEGGAVNVTNATTSNSSSNSSIEYLCLETTKCYTANANGVDWELHKILTPDTGTLLVVAGGGDDYKSCHFGDCVTSCYDKDGHLKEETTPSPSDTPTQQPTPSPTWKRTRRPTTPAPSVYLPQDAVTFGSERYQRLLNILLTASPDSEEALISDTPQRTALIWLYNSVMKLSNKRIVSRWILASFYYALNGDDWFNNRGWLSANNDECDWYGITCSEGKVTRIEMEENRCVGVLIPEIALWKDSLYYLSLGNNYDTPAEERNEIVMPLPEFLRELHLLSYLNLEGVGLSSIIPKNLFSNWNRLESLYLNDNDITGTLPSGITNLKTIRTLWMGGNNLGGSIISEIGQLTTLVDLSLESNFREDASGKRGFMTSLPASLGQLTKLEVLDLSDNALSGTIPLQLGNLISLRSLDLSNNFFESQLPSVLGKLQMLEDLDISWNWLSSTIPSEYGDMISLNKLSLESNYKDQNGYFTWGVHGKLPTELGKLKNLKHLHLNDNYISGTLVSEIGQLYFLETLHLQSNFLLGPIPAEYSDCVLLEEILLQDNNIDGGSVSMPEDICRLPELELARVDCEVSCSCCFGC